MKNIFIENHKTIRAISKNENVDMSVAVSMFVANAANIPSEGRVYGGAEVVPMADWAALNEKISQSPSEQLSDWTREYYEFLRS